MDSSYFAVQRRALEIAGFDPSTPQLNLQHPIWAGILMLSLVSHNWPMAFYALQDLSNITRLTDNLAVSLQGVQSTFKFLIIVLKRRRIGSLIHRLHKLNEAASATPKHLEKIERENQLDRYVSRSFRNAAYGVVCASALAPMLLGLWEYVETGVFTPTTPVDFNFWLDERKAQFYWPIYAWGVLGVAAAAWWAIATDTLFSWLIHNVVAQYQLLELALEEKDQQNGADCRLVECVRRHRIALDLAKELSAIFAEIVFVKYMLSYLQLCMLAFRFSRSGWSAQLPFRATFLLAIIIQISSYCYGGEYLKQQSLGIAHAVYGNSNWPKMAPRQRRLWQMVIMRAQRPARIFGFMFDVDLSLLLWVIRTAGSFLALLRTFERSPT
ncbi:odorant receptor 45a [Drosophila erecta]|uniref:Odorant receptor n=1 Tax=Drosophila erecta TaxID=7220 RepID=B3N7H8_DROER|nr:odorant receptor 45a [Drosophila erecta]EDV59383.1 uncharacterized protein Dere_GG23433 [Drosophila erecta]